MSSNKKQHYVPKMLLKRFANENSRFHVYNIRYNKLHKNVPYKNQCQEDYFYGNELNTEKMLSEFEGFVQKSINKILSIQTGTRNLTHEQYKFLQMFVVSQHLRTKQMVINRSIEDEKVRNQAKKIVDFLNRAHGSTESNEDTLNRTNPRITDKERAESHVSISFRIFAEYSDLKLLIINNETEKKFIISDNPSIMKNYYFPKTGYGLGNIGIICYLPIAPNKALLLIDSQSYNIKESMGSTINIDSELDVLKLNYWLYAHSRLLYSTNEELLNEVVERNTFYSQNIINLVENYLKTEITLKYSFLSMDEIDYYYDKEIKKIGLNNAISDFIDEDNLPSFLGVFMKCRQKSKLLYHRIPLRKNIEVANKSKE